MNEAEWIASDDPAAMLRVATGRVSLCCGCFWCNNGDGTESLANGQQCCKLCDNAVPTAGYREIASERELRLFACACFRAMGSRSHPELQNKDEAIAAAVEAHADDPSIELPTQCYWVSLSDATQAAREAAFVTRGEPQVAALLRDIIGNPFRPVTLASIGWDNWRSDHRRTIQDIAQRIYDERDWEAFTILGDALEDAGCDNQEVLRHCRGWERCYSPGFWHRDRCAGGRIQSPNAQFTQVHSMCEGTGWLPLRGPHARGCHVLGLLLGKE